MKQILAVLILLFVEVVRGADAPSPQFPWSSKVGDKIQEILRLKVESMTMRFTRSPDGRLGKMSNAALEELADLLAAEHLGMADIPKEGTSIEAKIATWALDRRNRKQAYEDFAFYYCNRPEVEKWGIFYAKFRSDPVEKKLALEGRLERFTGRYGPEPEMILPEDLCEEFRLPLEACYFLPPSGERFPGDLEPQWRHCLLRGIRALGSENSIVVFVSDIRCSLDAIKKFNLASTENLDGFIGPHPSFVVSNSLCSSVWLAENPRDVSYSLLAELYQIPKFIGVIDLGFSSALHVEVPEDHNKKRALYEAWQKLAPIQSDSEANRKLAEYIKRLTPPVYKDPVLE